jgi:hypothetical protein
MIHLIRKPATTEQISEMQRTFGIMIKLAVDVRRGILAGGGSLHADCEQALLKDGSRQEDVWGADWYPQAREVTFESLINIRPNQQNFGLEIQDAALREQIEVIVRRLLEVD